VSGNHKNKTASEKQKKLNLDFSRATGFLNLGQQKEKSNCPTGAQIKRHYNEL
jgi:hypothetical protein